MSIYDTLVTPSPSGTPTPAATPAKGSIYDSLATAPPAAPTPSIYSKIAGGAQQIGQDLSSVLNAPKAPQTPISAQGYLDMVQNWGSDVLQGWQDFGHSLIHPDVNPNVSYPVNAASDVAKSGLSFIGAFFKPITSVFEQAATVKGPVGDAANAVNKLFNAVGTESADFGEGAVNALPISQSTKDELTPVVKNLFALGGQIVLGKAGDIAKTKLIDTAKTTLQTLTKDPNLQALSQQQSAGATPTVEGVSQRYQNEVVQPAKAANQPVVLGSDNIKDIHGDYAPENHPIYSQATKDLFNSEVPQSTNPVVRFTAGGPGSGKTDFIMPSISKDFGGGVIYDSTLSNYKTLQDRLQVVKDAGKTPEVYGIIPDKGVAQHFSDIRGQETGRVVPQDFFDKTHAGVIDTLGKALENGDLTPDQVKLIDTRGMTDPNAIRSIPETNAYHPDPLALLKEAGYNGSNDNPPIYSGRQNESLPVSSEGGQNKGQPANDTRAGNGVLQKQSRIGRSIEQKAVEAKLTQGFDKTAGYDPITIKDQAERATKLINGSLDDARAVLRGDKPLPEGLRGSALVTAMEEHLAQHPAGELAYELANSPLVSGTSAAAQEMRLAAERVPDSLTAKFKEIKAAREAAIEKRGGVKKAVKKLTDDIQKEIRRSASKRPDWNEFIKEITCNS